MSDQKSQILLVQVRSGDEQAAARLFDRFVDRMIDLARSRLSPRMAQRLDPEDIVQSAYRSFFRNARAGRYELRQTGDLWRLLAAITVNKVRRQVRRHTAQRRAISAEEAPAGSDGPHGVPWEAFAREPSPAEAAALMEETTQMMSGLSTLYRQIFQLRLQGHSTDETARQAKCSERTVHRAMESAKKRLEQHLSEHADS